MCSDIYLFGRYVPPGFTAAEWSRKQKEEKNKKIQNKAKYPKGAPQA